ncbi:hypothetical protein HAZT_HAZT009267 [Hyalella azteca]|uniref:Stathmin n=1 Tax=Hyalella azteca TaxID=294128 RepID=A0A6A0H4A1_HYAAZ|nr:hypothetical protein HAZT_HAZT009267 [Hyalella azteca]
MHRMTVTERFRKIFQVLLEHVERLFRPTEIRAEEKSRGGMSYEVILSQAVTERPSSPAKSPSPPPARSITQQDIENKLELAEQRPSIGERLCRLEEAARKRQEANDEFICSTATALDLKLDASSVNREAHLDGLKAKVADHLNSVETVRKSVEEQTEKLREEILSKMSSAQENRDDHLRTIMAKLQAHEASVQRVRESHDRAVRDLEERIRIKQEVATDNREAEIEKKLEALRNHERRAEAVRANKEKMTASTTSDDISSG